MTDLNPSELVSLRVLEGPIRLFILTRRINSLKQCQIILRNLEAGTGLGGRLAKGVLFAVEF